jgi:citrate lyase subunit beta/citryl-CoA lyase
MENHAMNHAQAHLVLPAPMRSKLFVPGNRAALFDKAAASAADALSFDFEDSVPETEKQQARVQVGAWLQNHAAALALRKIVIVRTNAPDSPHFQADLEAAVYAGVHCINIPKVESGDQIRQVSAMLARLEQQRGLEAPLALLANIESPRGLRLAHEIALADGRVAGLQIGYGDLFEPLGMDRTDQAAVHQVLLAVRLAAGEAGIEAYDAAYANLDDSAGYLEEARRARRLGYAGKTCIHPTQIEAANLAFDVDAAEIAFSRKVMAAWREALLAGRGAITVEGRMIDAPFALRASRVLERAGILAGSAADA